MIYFYGTKMGKSFGQIKSKKVPQKLVKVLLTFSFFSLLTSFPTLIVLPMLLFDIKISKSPLNHIQQVNLIFATIISRAFTKLLRKNSAIN